MEQNIPEVSIIIINFNSSSYVLRCVDSIFVHSSAKNFEILIIDNDSVYEDYAKIIFLNDQTNIKLIRSRINLGFAIGNMLGIQFAHPASSFYFFLNNDCIFLNDVIKTLSDFLRKNPEAAIVTPQMYSPDKKVQSSFGHYPSVFGILLGHSFMRLFSPAAFLSSRKNYNQPVEIPYATGSALFVRAKNFNEIGGFDTNYFLFSEEEDLCKTMQQRGLKVFLVPDAQFVHFGGGSTNRSIAIDKEFYISYFYFIRKFYPALSRCAFRVLYSLKLLRKFYKDKKYPKLAWFVMKGAPMKYSMRFSRKIN